MRMKVITRAVALATVLGGVGSAYAAPFAIFDPRTLGMGGVGVASGDMTNASFLNPALLATAREEDDFTLILPTVAVGARDPGELVDALDTFEASVDALDAELTALTTGTPTPTQATAVSTAANQAFADFQGLGAKPVQINGAAGVVLGIPSRTLGMAVHVAGWGAGGGVLTIAPEDLAPTNGGTATDPTMQYLVNEAAACATDPVINVANCNNVNSANSVDIFSSVDVRGAMVGEAGVSFATHLDALGGFAIGVTPKAVKVETFAYRVDADSADINMDDGRKSYSDFNLDVGIVRELDENWRAGLVVKNLIAQEYDTAPVGLAATVYQVKIEPQARIGIAGRYQWGTVAADLDLTENEPLGLDHKMQHAAVGAELDLKYMLIRAGYRHNLAAEGDDDPDVYSVGFGFWLGFHLDLAVAGNDDEVTGSLQLGFSF